MLISSKVLGSRKRLFEDWSIPLPPDHGEGGGGGFTLADLIERIVRDQVKQFVERQEARQFIRALSATEINAAVEKGKIAMGGDEVGIQPVDADQAVATALQAFEDGLYLVAIDDSEQRDLDSQVFLGPDSRITFIRLTMLTGA